MAETPTFQTISRDLRAGRPAPVYLLHGEEGYYIDALAAMFEALVPDSERDFDLTVLYAPELDSPRTVVNAARRYRPPGQTSLTPLPTMRQILPKQQFYACVAVGSRPVAPNS